MKASKPSMPVDAMAPTEKPQHPNLTAPRYTKKEPAMPGTVMDDKKRSFPSMSPHAKAVARFMRKGKTG